MSEPILILGGGIAGLSAANRLSERGADVTLVEAGPYPQHKVCGEFISPEALPMLNAWNIPVGQAVRQVVLHAGKSSLNYRFPDEAGSCSRYVLDSALAQRAERLGCTLRTQSRIQHLTPGDSVSTPHRIQLAGGESLSAQKLLISTGRVPFGGEEQRPPAMKFVGFKAHFKRRGQGDRLDMYSFKSGYLGICSVDADTVNAAGLCSLSAYEKAGSPWAVIQALQLAHPDDESLQQLQPDAMVFEDWLITRMPSLGLKCPPIRPNVMYLGDAMGSIYPATGDGLAMAVTSGIMAADALLDRAEDDYPSAWHQRYAARIRWGARLHRLFLSPGIAQAAIGLGHVLPGVSPWVYSRTRECVASG